MTTASVYSLFFNQGKTREGSRMNFLHRTSMFMTHIQHFFFFTLKAQVPSFQSDQVSH